MSRYAGKIKWISYAIIAVSLLVLIRALPLAQGVSALRNWVEGLGVWGPLVFGLVYVVAVVAMIPASLLTLAGGATFGLVTGTITVWIASNVGAALALLIARYLARGKVEKLARKRPKFSAIDQAIREGGWKIVAMLRLSPAIPFNIQNYLYGLTPVRFWTCVLTSLVAMLPGTFMYVYLGHAAGSVTGGDESKSPAEWALLGVGLLATIGVSVYITRLAKKKLREQTDIAGNDSQVDHDSDAASQAAGDHDGQETSVWATLVPAGVAVLLACLAGVTVIRPELASATVRSLLPIGPPAVEMDEAYSNQAGQATFDHSTFDGLLQEYVAVGGWVDYEALAGDPSNLDEYLQALAAAPYEQLGRDEKLALLINAYNAFTLRLVLDHWPLESIKDIPSAERWSARRWNVGGNIWSLEQIEHEQIRPHFEEPRIHFVLVCAAVGCAPLANEAYVADRLEDQLQRQTIYVHSHPTWIRVDLQEETVALTPLYQWYRGDFLQSASSIVAFAARFSPQLAELAEDTQPRVRFLRYDWSLNSIANARPR